MILRLKRVGKGAIDMTMEDKRKFPRLSLKIEEGFFGSFKLANKDTLVAPIMNLSAGGLNMAVAMGAKDKIKEGDALLLQNIVGGTSVSFLSDIKTEIRWIKSLEQPGYIFVGCEFGALPDNVHAQIVKFVNSERMTRGQYD
jgi:c-di-GMP-binding flagellar brake protein YcgR